MSETTEAKPLRLAAAAKLFDVPTRQIVEAVVKRRIRYVMVEGIACIPPDALDEYLASGTP